MSQTKGFFLGGKLWWSNPSFGSWEQRMSHHFLHHGLRNFHHLVMQKKVQNCHFWNLKMTVKYWIFPAKMEILPWKIRSWLLTTESWIGVCLKMRKSSHLFNGHLDFEEMISKLCSFGVHQFQTNPKFRRMSIFYTFWGHPRASILLSSG